MDLTAVAWLDVAVSPTAWTDSLAGVLAQRQDRQRGKQRVKDHLAEVHMVLCHGIRAVIRPTPSPEDLPDVGLEVAVDTAQAPPAFSLPWCRHRPDDSQAALENLQHHIGHHLCACRDAAVQVSHDGIRQAPAADGMPRGPLAPRRPQRNVERVRCHKAIVAAGGYVHGHVHGHKAAVPMLAWKLSPFQAASNRLIDRVLVEQAFLVPAATSRRSLPPISGCHLRPASVPGPMSRLPLGRTRRWSLGHRRRAAAL